MTPAAQLALVLLALTGPTILASLGQRKRLGWAAGQAGLIALVGVCLWLALPVLPAVPAPDLWTLPLAAALTALFVGPPGRWLMRLPLVLGLRGFDGGLAALGAVPLPRLALMVVTNGVAEEVLYRLVALGLLAGLTGNLPLAAGLVVVAGALAHWPGWGPGVAVSVLISGAVMTLAYLLSGDLWAVILAHVAIDMAGIVLPRLRSTA